MNEVTKASVIEANSHHKSMARKAAEGDPYWVEQFDWRVREEWRGLVLAADGYLIRLRAEELWKKIHRDCTRCINDGMIEEDFDIRIFSPLVARVIERKINRHPELQLMDYKKFLNELHPTQLAMF